MNNEESKHSNMKWYDQPLHVFHRLGNSSAVSAFAAVATGFAAAKYGHDSLLYIPGGLSALFAANTVMNLRREIVEDLSKQGAKGPKGP